MSKAWNLVKPIIVIGLCILGYFQEVIFDKDVSGIIFLLIGGIYFLLHGKQVKDGVNALFIGGEVPDDDDEDGDAGKSKATRKKARKK